jgi:superfamily II DNA or RNA helicase
LRFTGELYHGQIVNGAKTADQRDIVRRLIHALNAQRSGACIVSPRAGKTVLATYVGCATKLRTLFIAADYMLLKQFEKTVFKFTDALKKPNSVGVAASIDDFDKFDHLVCTTWQALMERHSEGARLDAIFGQFGLIIVDEAHLGASPQFFKVLNSLDAKYMLAFTGTWKRKDGKEVVSALTFGKILVEEEVEALKPTVYVIETGVKSKKKKYTNFLSDTNGNVARHTLIAQRALDLVASDARRHVLITHKHGAAIAAIHRAIAAEALERQDDTTSLQDDGKLVTTYTGSLPTTGRKGEASPRDVRLAAIESGDFRIVVAQESMVRFGVNVPLWTDLILAAPVSSKISPDPNYKQLSLRPCR